MLPEEMLQRIAAGDAQAFRQLYALYKDKVYNTCLSYLQHVPEAEEVTQDVFIEVHQGAAGFKGTATVNTWIYRIAVNKCLDRLRYRNRQKRFAFISSLFGSTGQLVHDAPAFDHPGIKLEHKEKAAALFSAIRQLPKNQQTAFILKHTEGLPQKEIAAIMGMGEKAVESLLQRAKQNLRKLLSQQMDKNEGFLKE